MFALSFRRSKATEKSWEFADKISPFGLNDMVSLLKLALVWGKDGFKNCGQGWVLNKKGYSLTELITAVFLAAMVSIFISQIYLFIHQRFIEWERDQCAAIVFYRVSNIINKNLGDIADVIHSDSTMLEFIDTHNKKVTLKFGESGVWLNQENIIPKDASFLSGKLDYISYSDTLLEGQKQPYIRFNIDFQHEKKVYSLTGMELLDRYGTTSLKEVF